MAFVLRGSMHKPLVACKKRAQLAFSRLGGALAQRCGRDAALQLARASRQDQEAPVRQQLDERREQHAPDASIISGSSSSGGGSRDDGAQQLSRLLEGMRARWDAMDLQQRVSALAITAVALVALPKVLTLVVLGVERVLIGSLLALEEVLLELFYRGGIALGAAMAVGVVLYAAYAFLAPKQGGGGPGVGS